MQALLVAQDADEIAILNLALQRAGLTLIRDSDLDKALQKWTEQPADIIVLAGRDPVTLLRQVRACRAQTDVALLLITHPLEEEIQVALLDAGVDLLVPRPFSAKILIAQIRALLRRSNGVSLFTLPTLAIANLTLDPASRTVRVKGNAPARLTQLEFRLLYTLLIHRDQIMPSEVLVEHVWGYGGEGDRNLVRGLVSRLRAKVEPDPQHPTYIVTIPGVGYSFNSVE